MIPFKASGKDLFIPTVWGEVNLHQTIELLKMIKSDSEDANIEIVSILTGLTLSECKRITISDMQILLIPIMNLIENPFNESDLMNRPLPVNISIGNKLVEKFYSPGQMTWAQHLNFDNIITDKGKTDIEKMPDIIAVCIQKPDEFSDERIEELKPDILKMTLFDSFAIAGHYMREIKSFYEKANMKDTTEYTAEQIRAGIKEFSKFGAFNSIDTLAGGDITKWDKVVQLPMADVIIKLKMNQQHYKYEKKYNEIMTKKK